MKTSATAAIFLGLLVLFASAITAQTGATAWDPEMQLKVRAVGTPRVSPDGKRMVYTVSEAVTTPEKSEFVSQIWMANIAAKENVQITFGDKSSTNPKWSPDGNWIAFTSNRKDNKNNLYLLSLNGGEAEPLTDVKSAVTNFAWSPDGRSIAFTMTDPKSEEEEKNDKAKNDFRWVDENLKMSRLYVLTIQKDANGKREPRKLTTSNYNVDEFDWSPDSSRIAFSHSKTPVANDWTTSDVSIIEVATAKVAVLANTPAAESSPIYAPDGNSIAILVSDNPPRWAQTGVIQVFATNATNASNIAQPKSLIASYDGQPSIAGWSADGRRIYFSEAKGTATQIYALDVAANRIEEIKTSPAVYSAVALNRSGTTFAFVRQTPDTPGDAYVASVSDFSPVQISHVNADLRMPSVGRTEVIRWKAKDGKEIEGLLTYPVGYQNGQRVPVDRVIEMGVADPDRLGVMGWSYGGFMTSWIVTQTHRFKAASAGAPVTNLMSFNGTADIPSFIPDYFGGQSWDVMDRYQKHSPMFNVKGVTTPTMIQQGDADVRVPISQGYEFYNALKVQGVPTRMLVLPRQPHGPNEPKMQLAAMKANLEWFEKYLGAKAQTSRN